MSNLINVTIDADINLEEIIDDYIDDVLDYLEIGHKYYFIKPENLLDKDKVEFFMDNFESLDITKLKESIK